MSEPKTEARSSSIATPRAVGYVLRILADEEISAELGPEEGARLVVGQGRDCDLVLADRTASRRHFELTVVSSSRGSRVRLRDLASTNGTEVDGVAVREAFVRDGSVIVAGATKILVSSKELPDDARSTESASFGSLLGTSPQIRRLFPLLRKLAASDVPVLIQGETGTGKEVLAENLHDEGARADRPFIVFDCTTIHANLLEAALFGHERGAFTGATEARAGVFEVAEGGTLLIDEIGDLDLPLQGKLLRAIERSEVQRVGSLHWKKFNVRVLAATRRNLDQMIQEGKFRDDLFYRLAVGRVELPPLRERRGDVELLARKFAAHHGGTEADVAAFLARHHKDEWPGNIRELRNAMARHMALGELAGVGAAQVMSGDPIRQVLSEGLPYMQAKDRILAYFQHAYVKDALERHGGRVTQAAEASGLARRYFQKLNARAKDDGRHES